MHRNGKAHRSPYSAQHRGTAYHRHPGRYRLLSFIGASAYFWITWYGHHVLVPTYRDLDAGKGGGDYTFYTLKRSATPPDYEELYSAELRQ